MTIDYDGVLMMNHSKVFLENNILRQKVYNI